MYAWKFRFLISLNISLILLISKYSQSLNLRFRFLNPVFFKVDKGNVLLVFGIKKRFKRK